MLEQAPKFMVYGLIDPDTKELRYIGKSAQGASRINSHFYPSRISKDDTYKGRWIKKLAQAGKEPTAMCLRACSDNADALQQEIEMIAFFTNLGCRLTNMTEGGDGCGRNGVAMSQDTRERIAAAQRGVPRGKWNDERKRSWMKRRTASGCIKVTAMRKRRPLRAVNLATGEERWYLSSKHAAEDIGGHQGMVSNCVSPNHPSYSYKGWRFYFAVLENFV